MESFKRFVIVRLSSIGDVLHCTPVAKALKANFPSCHITWIVGQVACPMVQDNPFLDEIYIWSRERWEKLMRQGKLPEAWSMWRQLKRDMAARSFDVALDVHGLLLSGMVTRATGAPRRIGLSGTKEPNWLFMTERAPSLPGDVHVIQRYLSVLRPLGITSHDYNMTLCVEQEAKQFAHCFFADHNIRQGEKVVVFNPATTWSTKNWPPEFFARVADALASDARIVLCGGPGDMDLASKIIASSTASIINAVGRTSLQQMAGLLARADLVIVGDTGPLHMAVALGIPTVSIFGPTDPAKFGPLTPGHFVLSGQSECMPCYRTRCPQGNMRCMHSVRPDAVIAAARKVLCAKDSAKTCGH